MRIACSTCRRAAPEGAEFCPWDGSPLSGPPQDPRGSEAPTAEVTVQGDPRGPPAGASSDPLIGQALGEYEVRERIGEGGMGVVYRAVQPLINKQVAIKVLRPQIAADPAQVQRLLQEARAVNAIHHRGIVHVFGFDKLPSGQDYMVMEYLRGHTLDVTLQRHGPLEAPDALALLDEILAALAAAHGARVIHRDLKPSNIFLVQQADGSRYVKLLDFGLAKRMPVTHGSAEQTRVGVAIGTPDYMAPEQARGLPISHRTDLYALGVLTFEMLTGQKPFVADTPVDLAAAHVTQPPPRPSTVHAGVPPEVDDLVLALLAKAPARRPGSAEAVRRRVARLQRVLAEVETRLIDTAGESAETGQAPLSSGAEGGEGPAAGGQAVPLRRMRAPSDRSLLLARIEAAQQALRPDGASGRRVDGSALRALEQLRLEVASATDSRALAELRAKLERLISG